MGRLKVGKVLLGGLVAGVVANILDYGINEYLMTAEAADMVQRLNLPADVGQSAMVTWIVVDFIWGLLLVFTYASIRPRFGAGVKTAIIAGVTVWIVAMFAQVADLVMGILGANLLILIGIWSLVEMTVASIVGAWVYQEAAPKM